MPEPNDYGRKAAFPFQELLKASSIVFYYRDLSDDYPLRYISSNISELSGFSAEEVQADPIIWFDRIPEEGKMRLFQALENLTQTGRSAIEYRFKCKTEDVIWLRDEFKLVPGEHASDSPTVVGSLIDITEEKNTAFKLQELNKTLEKRIKERTSKLATANRKLKKQIQYRNKAEQKLREQNERINLQQLAIDNLNDMVIVTKALREDPLNSRIIFVNKAFEKFTGYSSDEVVGRQPSFLHGEQTSQKVLERISKQIEKHEPLREEFINYKKDGTTYWTELDMAPFPTEDEEYEYWVGINRDITQRKKAEQQLEESEKRYRAFAELSFDAIFEVNLDGTIQNCNKRACELFGYERDELIGLHTDMLIPKEYQDSQPDIISQKVTTGDEAWERSYLKKDGTLFPTEIHTQLFEVGGKKRLIAYVRDNTAHKAYQAAIQKSLREKETLLAEVHHRVKNNLAIISGLLEMQVFNNEDEQLLDKLKESQSRIQSIAMVHEKLYSSDTFSEIAIDQYINDLLNMIVGSMIDFDKEIHVEKDMDSVTLTVGQAIPCGLLLNELITNCYKHAFKDRDEGNIKISLKRDGERILMKVEDDGCGLPDDFQIENQLSLGMTIVSTLANQLGGMLEVSSDQGSSFQIEFEIDKFS